MVHAIMILEILELENAIGIQAQVTHKFHILIYRIINIMLELLQAV
jgi:hypothetical protein